MSGLIHELGAQFVEGPCRVALSQSATRMDDFLPVGSGALPARFKTSERGAFAFHMTCVPVGRSNAVAPAYLQENPCCRIAS